MVTPNGSGGNVRRKKEEGTRRSRRATEDTEK
jgi:hypothetical protein